MHGMAAGRALQKLNRKQEELLLREERILRVGRALLKESGYLGLTMDRLSAQVELSKPILYQHFSSKEELVMGLALENGLERIRLYGKAAQFDGRPRERMLALGAFAERIYPAHLEVEIVLYTNSIRAKASAELQQLLLDNEGRVLAIMTGIVKDAIALGDLELPVSMLPENFTYALWALNFGSYVIRNTDIPLHQFKELTFTKLGGTLNWAANAMMDGMGWRPLSTEWDYGKTLERIREQLLSEDELPSD